MKKLIAIISLCLFSIANALYLTIAAFKYKAGVGHKLLCDINDTLSCSSLFAFDFTWIFGIPFPAIALAVYPIIMIIAILGLKNKIKNAFLITMLLGLGGMCFNGYIIYHEFQVSVFCPACLLCSASITTIMILSLIGVITNKK